MEFHELVTARRSVRRYQRKVVPRAALETILEAANRAPSAGGLQAYEIVLVERQDTRSALAQAAYGQDSLTSAPAVLVFFANPRRNASRYKDRGVSLYSVQDATIAAAYAQLAAAAQGLGSCWVGAFDETNVAEILGAPRGMRPVAMLPIGYSDETPHAVPRRGIHHLVWHEKF
jgi:nitroreductase